MTWHNHDHQMQNWWSKSTVSLAYEGANSRSNNSLKSVL